MNESNKKRRCWFFKGLILQGFFSVFPTSVGVILKDKVTASKEISVPHECGGDPRLYLIDKNKALCSPRVWG